MKYLFQINKVLIIVNIILGFTIYLGLLFLIPLGIIQIIMAFIIAFNKGKLNKKTMFLFKTYCIITGSVLIGLLSMYMDYITNQAFLFCLLGVSIVLAFMHLKITHMIFQTLQKNENLVTTINS